MTKNQDSLPIKAEKLRKLPARYSPIAFAFFMSAIMAFLMCLVITAANNKLASDYLPKVFHVYQLAMPVAFVCVLAVRPLVLKLVSLCVSK